MNTLADAKRVCLVSMPFMPVNMPGMGVSTLKAALLRDGMACDVYYGALDFLKFFRDVGRDRDLRFDYDYIATNMHVGEVYFAGALWNDERAESWSELVIDKLTSRPNHMVSQEQGAEMATRLRRYAAGIGDFVQACFEARDWTAYDIVGFSSTFSQNVASLTLAKRIKAAHPGICIVFGGANCEGEMGEQLVRSFPFVDVVIRGEADFAFPQFVRQWRVGLPVGNVAGIVFRDGGGVAIGAGPHPVDQMDDVPAPNFDDFFEQLRNDEGADRLRASIVLPIETSRGCWWGMVKHCIFCGLNPTTMKFRSKSSDRALDDFRSLRDRYGESNFYAVDNILDRSYLRDLLPRLEGEGLSIFYETKSNLRESEVAQFARAGIVQMQPGIEGLSTSVLAYMKKGVKGYQNVELLKWCAMHGVGVTWSYLYGFPGEPEQPYWDAAAIMPLLYHLTPPGNANPILLDRYSPLYTQRDSYGLKNVRPTAASEMYYSGLTEAERLRLSYHFDMDLPQGRPISYEATLRDAILRWKYGYLRGARCFQFAGTDATLLIDTRGEAVRSFLLCGAAARIYAALRSAEPERVAMAAFEADREGSVWTGDSLILSQVASYLKSEEVAEPTSKDEVTGFIQQMLDLGLVLSIDGLLIALAIDCTDEREAAPFGLAQFVVRHGVMARGI